MSIGRRFSRLRTDIEAAVDAAARTSEVRRAMVRMSYSLWAALAVVAALGAHALLRAAG